MPPEFTSADTATQLTEAREAATESYREAVDLLTGLIEAASSNTDRTPARAALLNAEYGWAKFARSMGESAVADEHMENARRVRSEIASSEPREIPTLPSELEITAADVRTSRPPEEGSQGESTEDQPAENQPAEGSPDQPTPEPASPDQPAPEQPAAE